MIKILNHYLDKKERLLKYRRDYDLEKGKVIVKPKQKVITPIKNDTINRWSQVSTKHVMSAIILDLLNKETQHSTKKV